MVRPEKRFAHLQRLAEARFRFGRAALVGRRRREVVERVDVAAGKLWVRPWPGLFDDPAVIEP